MWWWWRRRRMGLPERTVALGRMMAPVRVVVVGGFNKAGPGAYPPAVEEDEDGDGGHGEEDRRLPGQHLDGRPGALRALEGLWSNHGVQGAFL
jgi:hypothetical protein